MVRALAVLLALVAAAAGAVGLAWLLRSDRMMTSEREAAARFEEERRLALDAGLEPFEESSTTDTGLERAFPVAEGECVALIVATHGLRDLEIARLSLAGRGHRDVPPGYDRALVHHAICADRATTGTIEIHTSMQQPDWPETAGGIRFAILRGAVADPTRYRRLSIPGGRPTAAERAVLARQDELTVRSARMVEPLRAPLGSAVVLPETRAAFAAARALTGAPELVPRFVHGADPLATAGDRAIPARAHTSRGVERLIAALDAGALGAPCVEVWIGRLDDRALEVRRIEIPTLDEITLEEGDTLARDVICPAGGLFLYVTDDSISAPFSITAYRSTAPDGAVASPSEWEPTPIPLPDLAAARTGCDAGDASACVTLAGLAAAGIAGAGEPRPPLERACAGAGGEACDRLATLEGSGGEASERRACATGFVPACLRRARRFLDGARDLQAAHATYGFACGLGDADACVAASTMREWQLASAGPTPTAVSLP